MGSKRSPRSEKAESQALARQGTDLPEESTPTNEEIDLFDDNFLADDHLRDQILEVLLEGEVTGPKMIAKKLGIIPDNMDIALPMIRDILWDPDFQRKLMTARKDPVISGIDRIKKKTHKFVANMEDLAEQTVDRRVQFAANQDLLNRAGTAPSQRVEVGPAAYFKALEGLIESIQPGDPNQPEGVVPEATVHPSNVAGGSRSSD